MQTPPLPTPRRVAQKTPKNKVYGHENAEKFEPDFGLVAQSVAPKNKGFGQKKAYSWNQIIKFCG